MNLLGGDGYGVFAATPNDADVSALHPAIKNSSVNEEWLQFFFLTWDGNYHQAMTRLGFEDLNLKTCGEGEDSILNNLTVSACGGCANRNGFDGLY